MERNEAIGIVRNHLPHGNFKMLHEALETLIPELTESKDERIRRELSEYLEERSVVEGLTDTKVKKEWITWLKQQSNNLVKNGYTDNKDVVKYADNYSHAIWHKLMDNFKNIEDYYIGCNEVSDIVLNAIIDTYNWLEKQGETFTKKDVDDAYLKGVCDTKHELEKQDESIEIKRGKNYLCTKTHKYAGEEWREGIKYYAAEDYTLINQGCAYYCPIWSKEEHNDCFREVELNGLYTNILSVEEQATLENLIDKLAVSGIKQYNTQTAIILFNNWYSLNNYETDKT